MNANADSAERTQAFKTALRWLSASEADGVRSSGFKHWLAQSPVHVEEALYAASILGQVRALSAQDCAEIEALAEKQSYQSEQVLRVLPRVSSVPLDRPTRLPELTRRRPRESAQVVVAAPAHSIWRWPRTAMRIIMTILIATIVSPPTGLDKPVTVTIPRDYVTSIGDSQQLTLDDGSTVHLNSNSSIRVYLSATARIVQLKSGEALFEVHHEVRPFRVATGGTVIQDVGTRFDVYRNPETRSTRVTVLEGAIEVSDSITSVDSPSPRHTTGALRLTSGQQVDIVTDDGSTKTQRRILSALELECVGAWIHGKILFNNESIPQALEEIGRCHAVRFVYAPDAIAGHRISGRVSASNLEEFLEILLDEFNIHSSASIAPDGKTVIHLYSPKSNGATVKHGARR